MSRSSNPDAYWDRLESWLSAMTGTLLSEAAGGLQHLSREQLDDNLSDLMSHDPTQDYSHEDLTKIIGSLAHNLLAQAKLGEASISRMEQEARNLVLARSQLDQLTSETQHKHRMADEKDPELQEEVERLQKDLTDLRVNTARREQWEKDTREELSEKLQQAEALLMRAETELKEIDARAKACEGHQQSSRTEISALAQQRDYLKEELDTVHRELKHAYRLQGDSEREMHTTEFPLTSRLLLPSQEFPVRKGGESPLLRTSPVSIPEPPAAERGWDHHLGAYAKQRTASEKTGKNPTIYPVANQSSELALEGAEPSHNDKPVNIMSRSFPASREQHGHGGARPKHQYERPERSWDRSQPPLDRRGGATWEAKRWPKGNRHSQTQAPSSDCQQQNPSQHALDKPKYKPSAEQNREATSESSEIMTFKGTPQEKAPQGRQKG
uniref:Uncharacterized protein n=1 Tax=Sinocyclocheilus anshuiensis TaxID=1608454 RepID=A0A671KEX2_9TELE